MYLRELHERSLHSRTQHHYLPSYSHISLFSVEFTVYTGGLQCDPQMCQRFATFAVTDVVAPDRLTVVTMTSNVHPPKLELLPQLHKSRKGSTDSLSLYRCFNNLLISAVLH